MGTEQVGAIHTYVLSTLRVSPHFRIVVHTQVYTYISALFPTRVCELHFAGFMIYEIWTLTKMRRNVVILTNNEP